MLEGRRYCPDSIIQLKAVRSAIKSVEANILKKHLENCITDSFSSKEDTRQKIAEIISLLDQIRS